MRSITSIKMRSCMTAIKHQKNGSHDRFDGSVEAEDCPVVCADHCQNMSPKIGRVLACFNSASVA